MISCFLSNISAKYYKNLSMLTRVIAKNVGIFFETQCSSSSSSRNEYYLGGIIALLLQDHCTCQ